MSYKKIYMSFNIKRHIHARVIFRCIHVDRIGVHSTFVYIYAVLRVAGFDDLD